MTTASAAAFQITIALGAFLLFLLQPMAARFLLPWFGGSPSVWSTCLLFFQAALLGGYLYAHLTRRLGTKRQAQLHIALLVLATLTLPIIPSPSWKPADASAPALRILLLLSATVGLPYVLLSATAPMVQDWFARLTHRDGGDSGGRAVYWLYALSNLGSLIGLLVYPSAIERYLSLHAQAWFWSAGFIAFAASCAWAGSQMIRGPQAADVAVLGADTPIRAGDAVMWLALSFCGTGLLLAVTNELCQNVAVVPLLWIVPLTGYLITFILCFSGVYRRWMWIPLLLAAVGAVAWVFRDTFMASFPMQVAALIGLLFSGCMVCHGELVLIRPPARHLTAFYLAIAAGGSIGGLAVALIAPLVFTRMWEFQLFAILPLLLLMIAMARDRASRVHRGIWRAGWAVLAVAWGVSTYYLVKPAESDGSLEVAQKRNFYGTLSVLDDDANTEPRLRRLRNGHILHGAQFKDEEHRRAVTTYYGDGSGVEIAIDLHPRRDAHAPLRIGVVGLGAGTIAGLGHTGDRMRFFEINPAAAEFARRYFTFLSDSKASIDVVIGDARLSLEREMLDAANRHMYDVLAIDAFSGDAIPVHLLTREAFALYSEALREDGVLAVHVSNHYLDLPPVVRGLAAEIGRQVVLIETDDDESRGIDSSTWMLVTNNTALLANAASSVEPPAPDARSLVWTDAFSSLLQVLKR